MNPNHTFFNKSINTAKILPSLNKFLHTMLSMTGLLLSKQNPESLHSDMLASY